MQLCKSTHTSTSLGKEYFQLKPGFYSCFSLFPHPVEHLNDGEARLLLAGTHFMSQGVTNLAGQRWCQIAEQEGRSTQAQCSKWRMLEGLRPTSLECGSASLSASETHLSNHRELSPWKKAPTSITRCSPA